MFTVPVKGAPNAFAQPEARSIPNLLPRPRDVERAALGVEVNTPPIYRRLDTEWSAHRLTHGAGHPKWPHRKMQARGRDAGNFGNRGDQVVQGGHLSARENVGPIRRGGMFSAQP